MEEKFIKKAKKEKIHRTLSSSTTGDPKGKFS